MLAFCEAHDELSHFLAAGLMVLTTGVHVLAGWGMVAVFTPCGMISYLPVWRRLAEPSFDRLNISAYGPLCLLIAALTT